MDFEPKLQIPRDSMGHNSYIVKQWYAERLTIVTNILKKLNFSYERLGDDNYLYNCCILVHANNKKYSISWLRAMYCNDSKWFVEILIFENDIGCYKFQSAKDFYERLSSLLSGKDDSDDDD